MEASLHGNAPYSELEQRRCNHPDNLTPFVSGAPSCAAFAYVQVATLTIGWFSNFCSGYIIG